MERLYTQVPYGCRGSAAMPICLGEAQMDTERPGSPASIEIPQSLPLRADEVIR